MYQYLFQGTRYILTISIRQKKGKKEGGDKQYAHFLFTILYFKHTFHNEMLCERLNC
jgi:hypothetical protein